MTVLLAAAQRHDNNHVENTRLQISAFEAINDMVGGMLAASKMQPCSHTQLRAGVSAQFDTTCSLHQCHVLMSWVATVWG